MHAQKGISIMYKCDRMERNKKEVKCGLTCDCFNVDLVSEKNYNFVPNYRGLVTFNLKKKKSKSSQIEVLKKARPQHFLWDVAQMHSVELVL